MTLPSVLMAASHQQMLTGREWGAVLWGLAHYAEAAGRHCGLRDSGQPQQPAAAATPALTVHWQPSLCPSVLREACGADTREAAAGGVAGGVLNREGLSAGRDASECGSAVCCKFARACSAGAALRLCARTPSFSKFFKVCVLWQECTVSMQGKCMLSVSVCRQVECMCM